MTINKAALKFHLHDDFKSIGTICAILLAVSILPTLFITVTVGNNVMNVMSGLEFMFGFVLFIGWIEHFSVGLHFFTQHGMSRRSIFASDITYLLFGSLMYAVAALLTGAIVGLVVPLLGASYTSAFVSMYPHLLAGMNGVAAGLLHLVWTWAIIMAGSALGIFVGSLYHILSTMGRYIALGCLILLVIVLPRFLVGTDVDGFVETLTSFVTGAMDLGSPAGVIGAAACVAAIGIVGYWLCVRRCKVKK